MLHQRSKNQSQTSIFIIKCLENNNPINILKNIINTIYILLLLVLDSFNY